MPEQAGSPDRREASLLDRRRYLTGLGGAVAAVGLGSLAGGATAATDDPPVDVGAVTTDHRWTTVQLADSQTDPVVVAPGLSFQGRQPAMARVRDVGDDAFDVSVDEWRYLDGRHLPETVGWLATPTGSHRVADGSTVEAGRVTANHRWTSATLSASFDATPVVFSQTQTVNGRHPIVTRHRGVSPSGLELRLQEEEAEGPHLTETVGYLAVEPGVGTLAGHAYEAGVARGVGDDWATVEFATGFRDPVVLADLQTNRGTNPCSVRYRNLTDTAVEVRVQEERSGDRETRHLGEQVGYLVLDLATGDTPLSELDRRRVERLVHRHVNERRAAHGLDALAFDADLREIARYHSEDMAKNDYFAHTSPSGETTSDRYERFGYDCRAETGDGTYYTSGENIAYTYYDTAVTTDDGTERYTTADELARGIVRGWMNSEGHRENILMAAWDVEGIGVYVTSAGKVYATQNFC